MSKSDWKNIAEYRQQIIDGEAIAIVWTVEDVEYLANLRSCTTHQAKEVLKRAFDKHDAEIGINWDVLDAILDEVLNEGP
jgi:hypothetical protein